MTQEGLEAKRDQLEELEKSEREAKRLEEALGRGPVDGMSSSRIARGSEEGPGGESESEEPQQSVQDSQSSYLPPHPGPNPARRRAPGMGFLSALSYTLHGMMDVDPATARRNGISKGRETISQVNLCFWVVIATSRSLFYDSLETHFLVSSPLVGGCTPSISSRSQVCELHDTGGSRSVPETEGC